MITQTRVPYVICRNWHGERLVQFGTDEAGGFVNDDPEFCRLRACAHVHTMGDLVTAPLFVIVCGADVATTAHVSEWAAIRELKALDDMGECVFHPYGCNEDGSHVAKVTVGTDGLIYWA